MHLLTILLLSGAAHHSGIPLILIFLFYWFVLLRPGRRR